MDEVKDFANKFVKLTKVENLQIEYLRKATELCDSCDDPLNEVQNLYDRLTK